MCAGCLPVIEQYAGVVVTILIRSVEIGEGRIVGGRIRDIALGADELSSGNLVAVDDGAVEGGHEDDGLDVGCRQRVHDLEDVEDLGNVEDDEGVQPRQLAAGGERGEVGHEEAEAGKGTMLAASFLRLAFNCPGNRRQVVTPYIVSETRWLKSP